MRYAAGTSYYRKIFVENLWADAKRIFTALSTVAQRFSRRVMFVFRLIGIDQNIGI